KNPHYANEFLYASERSKAAVSYQGFLMAGKMESLDIPSEIIEYKRQLDQEVINLQAESAQGHKQLIQKTQERDSLSEVIRINYPSYYNERLNSNYASVGDLQKKLDEESAFLIFQTGHVPHEKVNTGLTVMLVTKNNVEMGNFAADDLSVKVEQFLQDLKDRKEQLSYNDELYELLYLNRIKKLNTIKHLSIIASDELNYLPFDILADPEGRFIVEDFTVRYLQSASMGLLLDNQKSIVQTSSFIAPEIGGVTRGDGASSASTLTLSGTRVEVDEIVSMIGGNVLDDVSKEGILQSFSNSDLIHLATHAEVNLQAPGKSAIYLSNHPDSVIYAYELYKQNFNAALVTMSACNTGVGKIQTGEGIQSLGRAFSYAGCPNLIMSHWAVNDESTAELMQYLYQNLKEGMPKDEALRQAKLTYLANADPVKAHPYYWAGFTFSGDPTPLSFKSNSMFWWIVPVIIVLIAISIRSRKRNQS
ncbi:MAG: CHAT domain-containing protein, partial [Bacteroidota bacterium]